MSLNPYTQENFDNDSKMYIDMFGMLLLLTLITFLQPIMISGGTTVMLGLQLSIALVKASLIVIYYMHLKYETKLFKYLVYFVCAVLALLFSIMIIDSKYDNSKQDAFNPVSIQIQQ